MHLDGFEKLGIMPRVPSFPTLGTLWSFELEKLDQRNDAFTFGYTSMYLRSRYISLGSGLG